MKPSPQGRENYTMLSAANYIIVRDNLNSYKLENAKVEAKRLGIGLVFLPPYFPT
jgi:transposase